MRKVIVLMLAFGLLAAALQTAEAHSKLKMKKKLKKILPFLGAAALLKPKLLPLPIPLPVPIPLTFGHKTQTVEHYGGGGYGGYGGGYGGGYASGPVYADEGYHGGYGGGYGGGY